MTDQERIERRIAELKSELKELEIAVKVLRRLRPTPTKQGKVVSVSPRRKKPKGRLKIADTAEKILTEKNGEPAHYREVAAKAVEMGYRGRKGSTQDKVAKAFWATMKRQPDKFEPQGDGRFTLALER